MRTTRTIEETGPDWIPWTEPYTELVGTPGDGEETDEARKGLMTTTETSDTAWALSSAADPPTEDLDQVRRPAPPAAGARPTPSWERRGGARVHAVSLELRPSGPSSAWKTWPARRRGTGAGGGGARVRDLGQAPATGSTR
jgi:hypothetical protein